jgi:hypothetical protein
MDELPELPHGINDPQPFLPGIYLPWWAWLLIGLGVLALIVLPLLFWPRRGTAKSATPPAYYEDCKVRLEELRKTLADRPLSALATEASLALREYLSATLSEPALFETHEETLLRESALEALPQGTRDRLAPLLNTLADYKYGPSRTDALLADKLLADCLETLQGIESTRARPIA